MRYLKETSKPEYIYEGSDLGAVCSLEKTTWKVWSPMASVIILNLFSTGSDEEEGAEVLGNYVMQKEENGIWSIELSGDYHGIYYTYSVTIGKRTQESWDPYAKAAGVNGVRSMAVDLSRTNPEGWDEDHTVYLHRPTDALIWETHVSDYSSDESSGMKHQGKYLAFAEESTLVPLKLTMDAHKGAKDSEKPETLEDRIETGISWLKKMGVTHVQLQPFFDFVTVDERTGKGYNWGYDPLNFNVPEGSYSTDPWHGEVRIRECKQMIQALHSNGIGVIMDVVYNHTSKVPTSAFDRVTPDYYYRFTDSGILSNGSGCGNELATERPMVRRYLLDSFRYWAEEYHIDGFRLDLMAIYDLETLVQIRKMLNFLPNGHSKLLYGEPWSALPIALGPENKAANKDNLPYYPENVAVFSDDARNAIKGNAFDSHSRGYINGGYGLEYAIRNTLCGWAGPGLPAVYPYQSLIYDSIHDNYTLWDQLVHAKNLSSHFYDVPDKMLLAYNKLAAAIVFMSQGIPILHSGEEFARTKHGDQNSYKSGIKVNSLKWDRLKDFKELADYYIGLSQIRKAFSPLRESGTASIRKMAFCACSNQTVAFTLPGTQKGEWPYLAVMFNASDEQRTVKLTCWGEYPLPSHWDLIANETSAGLEPIRTLTGNVFHLPPRACWILAGKTVIEE